MFYTEFVDFRNSVSIQGFDDFKLSSLILEVDNKLKDFGIADSGFLFYPKGIFREKELVLYLFTESQLVSVHFLSDSSYQFNLQSLKDLNEATIEYNTNSMLHRKLVIYMANKEIVLSSKDDTNSSWANKLAERIDEIYKHLIKESQ